MNQRNPTLAVFHLFVGCFITAAGLFVAWNAFEEFAFMSFTLIALGGMTLAFAVLYVLPDGPGQARTLVRALAVALSMAAALLAVTAILAGLF